MYEPDKIDREYLAEMARILGHSEGHEKIAAMKGTPAAPAMTAAAKKAKEKAEVVETKAEDAKKNLNKIASIPLRTLLQDPNYQRGFNDEIEARRSVWEPAVVAWLRGEE